MEIHFYFDVACPFAYIASTQIDRIGSKYKASVTWVPVSLPGLYTATKAPQGTNSPISLVSPQKRKWVFQDLLWHCNRYEIPFKYPTSIIEKKAPSPVSTLNCMRVLTYIEDHDIRRQLAQAYYHAYFVLNEDITDSDVLAKYYHKIVPSDKRGSSVLEIINDETVKKQLNERTEKAASQGIFGVPTFIINNDFAKEFYFGMDRLPFIEMRLKCHATKQPLHPPVHRLMPNLYDGSNKNKIEFFFDFGSPWSFLGFMRLHELRGFGQIELKPVLLGGILKSIGTPNAPLIMSDAKKEYSTKDTTRWFGCNGVWMKFSSHFPLKTVLPLRVCLVDNRTIDCIYRATWQRDLNIGESEVLCKVLEENGFDGKDLIAKTEDPKIKQKLQDNTSLAVNKGIFGVPTFVVNGDYDRIVWGQDRIDLVKDLCNGWKPPLLNSQFAYQPKTQQSAKL